MNNHTIPYYDTYHIFGNKVKASLYLKPREKS